MKKLFVLSFLLLSIFSARAQTTTLEGYVFEDGNRGYLNVTQVVATEVGKIMPAAKVFTDVNGYFLMELEPLKKYELKYTKDFFKPAKQEITMKEGKTFTKMSMKREPGYSFEITLADKREDIDTPTDGIKNTRIEVYNNTTQKAELVIENHPEPHFDVHLDKGNHYTILVRKEGYFAKRMEVNVAVHGCILCFEGVGTVTPGVTDNLTEGNENGVLLANVEMDRLYEGKTVKIENLYYDLDKSYIRADAAKELDKVIKLMKYNPNIQVELGSHTDSRGKAEYNMELSQKRAKAAVDYLIDKGGLDPYRIQSRGYGELILTNECADGIKCSEEKHQKNRRTELKVLGVEKQMIFTPLAEMKQMEEFEQMIINGGSMAKSVSADELAKIKAEEEKTKAKVNDIKKSLGEEVNIESTEEVEPQAIVVPDSTQQEPKMAKESFKMQKYKELNESSETIKEVNTEEENGTLNGIKIVLFETDKEIPTGHPMYMDFNISTFSKDSKSTMYMVDKQGMSRVEAEKMLKTDFLLLSYPKAYIVEFKDGKLVK